MSLNFSLPFAFWTFRFRFADGSTLSLCLFLIDVCARASVFEGFLKEWKQSTSRAYAKIKRKYLKDPSKSITVRK